MAAPTRQLAPKRAAKPQPNKKNKVQRVPSSRVVAKKPVGRSGLKPARPGPVANSNQPYGFVTGLPTRLQVTTARNDYVMTADMLNARHWIFFPRSGSNIHFLRTSSLDGPNAENVPRSFNPTLLEGGMERVNFAPDIAAIGSEHRVTGAFFTLSVVGSNTRGEFVHKTPSREVYNSTGWARGVDLMGDVRATVTPLSALRPGNALRFKVPIYDRSRLTDWSPDITAQASAVAADAVDSQGRTTFYWDGLSALAPVVGGFRGLVQNATSENNFRVVFTMYVVQQSTLDMASTHFATNHVAVSATGPLGHFLDEAGQLAEAGFAVAGASRYARGLGAAAAPALGMGMLAAERVAPILAILA